MNALVSFSRVAASAATRMLRGATVLCLLVLLTLAGQSARAQSPVPAGIAATAGTDHVTLAWNPAPGAISYSVYRATAPGSQAGVPLARNVPGDRFRMASFTDRAVSPGRTYYYRVTMADFQGESAPSREVSATPGIASLPAPALTAAASPAQVTFHWTAVPGAVSYNLYRSTDGKTFLCCLKNLTGTSYVETQAQPGVTCSYRIAPVCADGQGAISSPVAAAPAPAQAADAASDTALSALPGSLNVARGQEDMVTIRIHAADGFRNHIALSVAGLPRGVTAGFSPPVATASGSYLNLSVGATARPGSYALTVTGAAGKVSHSFSLMLSVEDAANGDQVTRELTAPLPLAPPWQRPGANLGAGLPGRRVSLLNDIGALDRPIAPAVAGGWDRELHRHPAAGRAALLHLWLGEWQLAHNQQPAIARRHLRQAQRLTGAGSVIGGTARYEAVLSLFYEGAYAQAADEFHMLLTSPARLAGYSRQTCALWMRHAVACAGFHASRARLGIPEPARLDPKCGDAALATALRARGLGWDEARVLAACPITGEGNSLADLVAGAPKLGVKVRTVVADDRGLLLLPKPLIAYVERDHFIAVIKADKSGVSYLCSDCGAWPGGRVDLSWSQWHALEPTRYGVVVQPGGSWDRLLGQMLAWQSPLAGQPVQVASRTLSGLGRSRPSLLALGLHRHVTIDMVPPGGVTCGGKPPSPPCPPQTCCPQDGGGGPGPTGGDPVNLATGEEEYRPADDLDVYNPYGPSISWARNYRSLRSTFETAYQYNDFGAGWSQSYNLGVYDPTGGGSPGTKYFYYPTGARISFSAPSVPTAGTPVVACTVQAGVALLVEWDYDANRPSGYFTITMPDRTKWVTTGYYSPTQSFLLQKQIDRNGNAIRLVYGAPVVQGGWPMLSSIVDDRRLTALLSIKRANDGTGNIVSVTDVYNRSIYYHVGFYPTQNVPGGYPQSYQQVDHISLVVPAHTGSPPDRWSHGYMLVSNLEGQEKVPFLHSITVPSPSGSGTSSSLINYDPSTDFVSSLVDANGNTRTYTPVDQNGNPTPYGSYTKVTYADSGGHADYVYTVSFDNNLNGTSRTDGSGHQLTASTFADPNDPFQPSAIADGNGHSLNFTYDAFGNVQTMQDQRGTTTTNTFSYSSFALGELTQTQAGTKSPTKYTYYEPSGLTHTITLPQPGTVGTSATVVATFTYDTLGNPLTIVAPGNLTSGTITTTFNYAADGSYSQNPAIRQPLTETDNLGHVKHYRYDSRANLTSKTDALGNVTAMTYNLADQAVATAYPATGQTGSGQAHLINGYAYTGGPQLTESRYDESGTLIRQTTTSYGLEGELLGKSGDVIPVSYTYDSLYRIKSVTDGNGHATQYAYNAQGYLASMTFPNGDKTQYTAYDADGNLLKRIDGRGVETDYTYNDPESLLTKITYPSQPALNVQYTYDNYGRLSTMTDGTGSAAYGFDDNDLLTSAKTTFTGLAQQTMAYAFNNDGSIKTMTTPAGSFTYAYDGAGRRTSLVNPFSETTSWTYLNNDWLKTQALNNGVTTTYTYNARRFLLEVQSKNSSNAVLSDFGGTGGMQYDALGNLKSVVASVAGSTAASGTTTYQYDTRYELTQEQSTRGASYTESFAADGAGNPTTLRGATHSFNIDNQDTAFVFDGSGNPTTYKGATLTFDAENRLTSYGGVFTAGYNGNGRRVYKGSGSSRRYYLYDSAGHAVVELDSTGAVSAVNTFGSQGVVSRHTSAGSVFYTLDQQGNVAQRLTGTGTVSDTAAYDGYGQRLAGSSTDPWGYQAQEGYYTDSETGLCLLMTRYYDPAEDRFLNRDPSGYDGGINLYAYCNNDPIHYADPTGLTPKPSDACKGYAVQCGIDKACKSLDNKNPAGKDCLPPDLKKCLQKYCDSNEEIACNGKDCDSSTCGYTSYSSSWIFWTRSDVTLCPGTIVNGDGCTPGGDQCTKLAKTFLHEANHTCGVHDHPGDSAKPGDVNPAEHNARCCLGIPGDKPAY